MRSAKSRGRAPTQAVSRRAPTPVITISLRAATAFCGGEQIADRADCACNVTYAGHAVKRAASEPRLRSRRASPPTLGVGTSVGTVVAVVSAAARLPRV